MASTDEYIYHYTSDDTAKNYILPNGTLQFSNLGLLNDPEELAKYGSIFLNNSDNSEKPESIELLMKYRVHFPTFLRSSSFSHDRIDAVPYTGKNYHQTKDHNKKGFMLSRMWAMYGDNHKGVCLCFNKKKLIKSLINSLPKDSKLHHADVNYSINQM
jgi:hypothetical protein